jgi:hypothetical protein
VFERLTVQTSDRGIITEIINGGMADYTEGSPRSGVRSVASDGCDDAVESESPWGSLESVLSGVGDGEGCVTSALQTGHWKDNERASKEFNYVKMEVITHFLR